MRNTLESLDIAGHNLANAGTTGYKVDKEVFNLVLSDELGEGSGGPDPFALSTVSSIWTDHQQGTLTETGQERQVGLRGSGFLAADAPQGVVLTRHGHLQVTSTGRLATPDGFLLQTTDGRPYRLDPRRPFQIERDGRLQQDGQTLTQIKLVDADPAKLTKAGHTYFSVADPKKDLRPSNAELYQGYVESSNASAPEAAVRLIEVVRQMESVQRAIQLGSEMNRRSTEEVARWGGQ